MSDLIFTILRPEGVRFRRVLHPVHGDVIVQTIEFAYEDEIREAEIAYDPEGFGAMIVASLNALGFPEQDTEYIADRILRDLV